MTEKKPKTKEIINKDKDLSQKSTKIREKPIISRRTLQKMLPAERKAVQILLKNPDLNNAQLGKELKRLGLTKDNQYVTKRTTKSDLLCESLSEVRHKNIEILSKELVPLALEQHKKALKDKKLTRDQMFRWVKLAEDKEFGADERRLPSTQPKTINIQSMKVFWDSRRLKHLKPKAIDAEVIDTEDDTE